MAFRNISVVLEANDTRFGSTMQRAASTVDSFGRRTDVAAKNAQALALASSRLESAVLRQSAAQETYNRMLAAGETDTVRLARAQSSLISANRSVASAQQQVAAAQGRAASATRSIVTANDAATGSMGRLENVVERVSGRALAGFAIRAFGVYQAGRAVNEALQSIIGGAVQFDARMRNVNSISGLTETQLHGLSSQVLDLSRVLPQSANNLAEGLYDVASSGFQGAAGVQVLAASAKAATAGLTDTATSAQAIAGVLNAYGEGASQARNVSDSLFQTVNLGVLSFADLAQGIGTVIGTASAASISIDQVGAAIATMTRAGIVPAEAFTSLNQVLAQIIQPGDAMTRVFNQLGYESGAAALQSKGLAGVMADLRQVTGGDITSMSQLFTDVRSLRGALALTANGGALYNQMLRQQADAHKGAGATATAFSEQMKAVGAQWDLFKNRVQAAAIETGTHLLPALLAVMHGTASFGNEVGGAVQRLAPYFHNLVDAGGSLLRIITMLASAAVPLVRVLATLGATAVVGWLTAWSAALAAATGFVADHRAAAAALAAVITVALLPSIAAAVAGFAAMTSALAGRVILNAVLGMSRLAGAIQTMGAAGLAAGAAVTFGIGLAIYELTASLAENQRRAQQAAQTVQEIGKAFDALRPGSLKQVTEGLNDYADAAIRVAITKGSISAIEQAGAAAKAAADKQAELNREQQNTDSNLQRLASSLGVSTDAVRAYAAANHVDLTKPWKESQEAVDQVSSALSGLAHQAGVSLPQLGQLAGNQIDQMTALADAVKKATDATAQAFTVDIVTQFQPAQAAASVDAARKQVAEAQKSLNDAQGTAGDKGAKAAQRLTDYETRLQGAKKISIAQEQHLRDLRAAVSADPNSKQVADARDRVAEATRNLAKAQQDAKKTGDLSTIYESDIAAGRRFVTEINDAVQRGLDPQLIARLLQEGPEKAGPLLDTLVRDHSNRLIRLADSSERTLAQISSRAVEMARLTALAMNAQTDRLGRDLPAAMHLAQQMAAQGSRATAASLIAALHLPASELQRIAQEFGITLPRAIQTALDRHPVHVRVARPSGVAGSAGARNGPQLADGGQVRGPGTATSDSIPAWLSNGEFVVKAKAVNHYGTSTLHALNKMTLPRYADGGYVGRPTMSTAGPTIRTQVIVREVRIPQTVTHETNLNGVQFTDAGAYEQFAARQRRSRSVWT